MTKEAKSWLVFVYRVPQEPAGHRTYVWRQLKQLGAVYLQQAAALLPERPELVKSLQALAERIRSYSGEVSLLTTTSSTPDWELWVLSRFNDGRDAEYEEIIEGIERFEDEIKREERKDRFNYAQLEDLEGDWQKLKDWFGRVQRRDYFGAAKKGEVEDAFSRAHTALEIFTNAVYTREEAGAGGSELPGPGIEGV